MKPLHSIVIILTMLLTVGTAHCQQTTLLSADDHAAVLRHSTSNKQPRSRHIDYGFNTSWPVHGAVYHLFASSMYVYQSCISPSIARSCAFRPTCSGYSKALISEYGLLKGIVCSADRIMRCNRIALADRASHSLIDPIDNHIHEGTDRYRLR